jgi:type II secretory pathway pseudopilin PulG
MRQIKVKNPSPLVPHPSPPEAGFTFMETLIAVAMLSALSLLVAPLMQDSLMHADAGRYADEGVDALREAQAATMSGKNNARYGVHFEGTKFVFFQGATYSGADPNNVEHALTGNVTITAVSLSPGGACTLPAGTGNCDVHFASRKGTPTETGSVTFTGAGGQVETVTVNAAGLIDAN